MEPALLLGESDEDRWPRCRGGSDSQSPHGVREGGTMAESANVHVSLMSEAAARAQPIRELDDSGLVAAFLNGEKRAFNELVSRYHVRLLNFIHRTIGDRERAEDLVQETFVRVYRHLHRFDQSKKFSTWAYTIAGNLAKNELRNRSRNPLVLFQTIKKNWDADHRPLEWEDNTYRPDDLYRKRHLKEMVDNAVAQLPEHHRLVFVLREMEGKTYEEISEITGVNLGTVKSRLNRARNNFAQLIAPLID
jgi:RNA polymerase sigma-70 factor (ECF subfamily)